MAVASLVLGILGLIASIIPPLFVVGVPLALIATVLGVVSRRTAAQNQQPTGLATGGMVTGIIGVMIGVAMYAACAGIMNRAKEMSKDPKKMQEAFEKNKEFQEAFKKAIEESQNEGAPGAPGAAPKSPAAQPASPAAAPASPAAQPASPVAKPASPVAKPASPAAK
jgi:hypothetical protein